MILGNWVKSHNNCSLAQTEGYGHLFVKRENVRMNVFPLLFLYTMDQGSEKAI
jgi:hypothetical protein